MKPNLDWEMSTHPTPEGWGHEWQIGRCPECQAHVLDRCPSCGARRRYDDAHQAGCSYAAERDD